MAAYDYDLIVIGGGAAGLTAAGIAANAGVKTMMIEKERLGGDCTWTGCIPSKSLLHSAEVARTIVTSERAGVYVDEPGIDFQQVMARMRDIREDIYKDADEPSIYEAFGIDVQTGAATFADEHTVEISHGDESNRFTSRFFVLATGGRPSIPPIPGLADINYLTSENLFEIEEQPSTLAIIGAGPIGIEMAQAFTRLGTKVTVLDIGDRILAKDDTDNARILHDVLVDEGVEFLLEAAIEQVKRNGHLININLSDGKTITTDAVLVATGRSPNIEHLGLDSAGVENSERGITINERCRTSRRHIYAVGDCTGEYQLTHMSEHMAKVAATNIVLKIPMKLDRKHVPWVTYTSPEVAQLGKTEAQLREEVTSFEVFRFPYARIDRAITDDATVGQIKVIATKWRGRILGVSIVGARAGELISQYAIAMRNGVSLKAIADTIHPYPTYALGARRAADQWYARKQFPWAVRLLQRIFRYRGQVPPEVDPIRVI